MLKHLLLKKRKLSKFSANYIEWGVAMWQRPVFFVGFSVTDLEMLGNPLSDFREIPLAVLWKIRIFAS